MKAILFSTRRSCKAYMKMRIVECEEVERSLEVEEGIK